MKNKFIYFIAAAIILQTQVFANDAKTYEWGALTNKVQMSISLANNTNRIKIGESIRLLIQLRNTSTNEIFGGFNSLVGSRGLSFEIINPSNRDVSPIYTKDYDVFSSGAYFSIPPNQTKSFKYDLDALCKSGFLQKFDQVGTYKIIAMRKGHFVGTNQAPFTITSNQLNIMVVNDK